MLHKAPGFFRFSLQIISSLLRVSPATHADLGHSFPEYPVLHCFIPLWVGETPGRVGLTLTLYSTTLSTDTRQTLSSWPLTLSKVYYLFLHTTPRTFSQDSLLSLGLWTFTVWRGSFAPFSSSSNPWKPAGL